MDLLDQTILITGAAGRIGSATAKLGLSLGAKLVLVDISSGLESLVDQMPVHLQKVTIFA